MATFARDPGWLPMFLLGRLLPVRRAIKLWPVPAVHPGTGESLVALERGIADASTALERDGIATGLRLKAETLQAIRAFAASAPCYAAADPARPVRVPEGHLSGPPPGLGGSLIADYREGIAACPAISGLWSDPLLLSIATRYLRRPAVLKRSRLWWTFSGLAADQEERSTFSIDHFHYDLDDWLCLKFFFYISDVDADAGPHAFIRGSQSRRRLSHQLTMFKGHSQESLAGLYAPEDFLVLTGPAGTGFAEDPYGFHTGTSPVRRNRLMLEVEYGMSARRVAGPYGSPR
ncbi:MAG TPA: hypothetical protein VED40_02055 [Azospirillaceae bacterium]|nr:hypothetical protein [Azospirillaceae bacterium]